MAVGDINAHNIRVGLPLRVALLEGGDDSETQCGVGVKGKDPVTLLTSLMNRIQPQNAKFVTILAGCHSDCGRIAHYVTVNGYDAMTVS